jgi:hypothetical protein
LFQAAVLSPTQIEHGSFASQVSVELGSKPFGLLLVGSFTSGVVAGLPVGSIQKSIVKLTLPLVAGTTWEVWPTFESCMVRPSQSVCDVGSGLHSSKLIGVPGIRMLFAGMLTLRVPPSPK